MAQKGPAEFSRFMVGKVEGDLVTLDEILKATPGWKKSSVLTYFRKNKLAPFLAATPAKHTYRVVRSGSSVTEADVNKALSQVAAEMIPLVKNDKLTGERGEYVLVRELGAGAVGQVWSATTASGTTVAVKVCSPRPDLLKSDVLDNVKERFRRESRLSPRLSHDTIISYVDRGEYLTTSFIVMELAKGSLKDHLNVVGSMSTADTIMAALRIAEGLAWIHSQSCVHRDVKPANVLESSRGWVLGDMGIVKWGDLNPSYTGAGTITKTAVQLGSFHYMAPEQYDAPHAASPASDVYAFGITCIEMLVGSAPIPNRVAAGRVPPPSDSVPFNQLIARMTAFDAVDRPDLDEIRSVLSNAARTAAHG